MNTSKHLQAERETSFEIRTIEWLKLNKGTIDSPWQHNNYQIVWITRGSGHCHVDLLSYQLTENSLLFVPPGGMHQLRPSGELSGYVISFAAEFLLLSSAIAGRTPYDRVMTGCSKYISLTAEEGGAESTLMAVLKSLIREYQVHSKMQREILSGLLHMLLIYLYRICGTNENEGQPSKKMCLVNNFRSQVEKHFLSRRPVAAYANDLLVTPTYLSGVVRSLTGYSANHHIQQRIVIEAKRLAMYSDYSMKEVAYKLGFEDPSHFSKFFRNMAGINFSEFKNGQEGIKNAAGDVGLGRGIGLATNSVAV